MGVSINPLARRSQPGSVLIRAGDQLLQHYRAQLLAIRLELIPISSGTAATFSAPRKIGVIPKHHSKLAIGEIITFVG